MSTYKVIAGLHSINDRMYKTGDTFEASAEFANRERFDLCFVEVKPEVEAKPEVETAESVDTAFETVENEDQMDANDTKIKRRRKQS